MKVVHGTMMIANQAPMMVKQMRQQGVTAVTFNYYRTYLNYDCDFDYILADAPDDATRRHATTKIAANAMVEFDVFHFWFNTTFTLDYSDLPMLANLGAPLFMQHAGSDVRTLDRAKAMNKWAVVKPMPPEAIHQQLSIVSRYIRTAIVGEERLFEYVKDYYDKVHMVPITIDLEKFTVADEHRQNERPLVVHAPTSPEYKGTKYVIEAVQALQKKYDFDFQLVQGMAHEDAIAVYRKADIILDQFLGGGVGGLATEGMALGKTVLCWVCDRARAGYPEEPPVIVANPDTLQAQLERVLNEPGLREDIGPRARTYVERYHDVKIITDTMLKIYRGEGIDGQQYQPWWGAS